MDYENTEEFTEKMKEQAKFRGICVICGELGSGTGTDGQTYCSPECARKNNAEPDMAINDEVSDYFADVEEIQYAEPDDDEGLVEAGNSTEEERGFY